MLNVFSFRKITVLAVFFLILLTYSFVFSREPLITAQAQTPLHYKVAGEAEISAKAFVVFDVETGEVLASQNADQVLPIASVTKLFTATVLFEEFDLEARDVLSMADIATEGRAGKLEAGDSYTYRELLFPLLLESSNDAAAFYERVTKNKVVNEMNQLVRAVGMEETAFADASGLSNSNLSSASDLMKFISYLYSEALPVLDITRLKKHVGIHTGWINNSPVMEDNYLGGKHGYTVAAGRTLVALFAEEISGVTRTIGYVILDSTDLTEDMDELRAFTSDQVVLE